MRLSFSTEEQAAKDPLASYLEELGFEERKEAFGDVIGSREVGEAGAPFSALVTSTGLLNDSSR